MGTHFVVRAPLCRWLKAMIALRSSAIVFVVGILMWGATASARSSVLRIGGTSAAEPETADGGTTGLSVTYMGGALIQHVKVVTVYWGTPQVYQKQLNDFFAGITQSQYLDWLKEYDTPSYSIGRGSWTGEYVDQNVPAPMPITTVPNFKVYLSDQQVRDELSRLIDAGTLSADDDTLFMIYFPPGLTVEDPTGSFTCNDTCAYHESFKHNGQNVRYGIMADITQPGCKGGCGMADNDFSNFTIISSHELMEAITDPDFDVSPGWRQAGNWSAEVGDLCERVNVYVGKVNFARIGNYAVQQIWSNHANACVVAANDFSVSVDPWAPWVPAGSSTSLTVQTTILNGIVGTLTLGTIGVPNDVSVSLTPSSLMAGSSGMLNAAPTAQGVRQFVLSGQSGDGITHFRGVALKVDHPVPDLSMPMDMAVGDLGLARDLSPSLDLAIPRDGAAEVGGRGKGCGCTIGGAHGDASLHWTWAILLAVAWLARRLRQV